MTSELTQLTPGQELIYGGNRVARVTPELAAAFRRGDRLVVVHDSGDVLHIPQHEHDTVSAAVQSATDAFRELGACTDEQITAFFQHFAELVEDDVAFGRVLEANRDDVSSAQSRQRSTTRLVLSERMRADMAAGLRSWAVSPIRRAQHIGTVVHEQWSVSSWRDPLGVVGFVFEGRPNVFADATGVLRTGNTAVFRIGSDALGTARAIMSCSVRPALQRAGLPAGAVQLIDSPAHAAGWALFADARIALAIARGSGKAVAQLGAVARQHGVPVSLHGTGGAWLVASEHADSAILAEAVLHSLDRKVCNTLNVCCVVAGRAEELMTVVVDAAERAAAARGTKPVIHRVSSDQHHQLGHEWEWEEAPEMWLTVVDSVEQAVELFNRWSPRLAASLISDSAEEQERFYSAVDAPFVGNGFTRWVDGQFALHLPELGLSNWQSGRLFARSGVLSGDSVFTVRMRADVRDHSLHR